ncbi:uncharacterized protein LOC144153672 isoform X2 [Haemaphysalis longicornis]
MKAALLLCLAVVCLLSGAVSERKVSNRRQRFEEWRECMVATLPEEKATEYQNCHERARGTSMRKFREGLRCVLGSYGIVNRNSVNLTAMAAAASSINKTELKKAFQDCPEDDHNAQIAKAVKCVIDSLEVSCPVVEGAVEN